jgi:tetratricopeptide (TPR) repeat protein
MIPTRKATPEQMARRYFLKKKWNKAIEQYQKCLQEGEADLATVNLIGDAYYHNNEQHRAFEYYQKALAGYKNEGLLDNALAMAKKMKRLNPEEASLHLKLAELYTDQTFLMDAINHLNSYLKSAGKRFDEPQVRAIFQKMAETPMENPDLWRQITESYRDLEINDPDLDQIMAPGSACPTGEQREDTVDISHDIKGYDISDTMDQIEAGPSLSEDVSEASLADTGFSETTEMDALPDDTPVEEESSEDIQLQDALSEVLPVDEEASEVEIPTDILEPHEEALEENLETADEDLESMEEAPEEPLSEITENVSEEDEGTQDALMTLPYDEEDELSEADLEAAAEENKNVESILTGFTMDEVTVTQKAPKDPAFDEEEMEEDTADISADVPDVDDEEPVEESLEETVEEEAVLAEEETTESEIQEESLEEKAEPESEILEKDLQDLELSELAELKRKEKNILPDFDGKEHMELGKIYREMKLWDAAIAEFKTAALDPRWRTTACVMLSECFQKKGELVLAISQLKWALSVEDEHESDEDKYTLHYELGSLFESAGDFSQAREHYQEVHRWNAKHKGVEKKLMELRKKMQTA